MKTIFYSFILLFASVLACAQRTVNYVSFFPPAHIVHNEVQLTQDADSFNYGDDTYTSGTAYHAMHGGLVLGAAPGADVKINNIAVRSTDDKTFAIVNFNVDNIIKVSSTGTAGGTIGYINIGVPCPSNDGTDCSTAFISANQISLPVRSGYPGNADINVRSYNLADVNLIRIVNSASDIFPGLQAGDKLTWLNLRINGTEECRKYLVRSRGTNGNFGTDNCARPPNPDDC